MAEGKGKRQRAEGRGQRAEGKDGYPVVAADRSALTYLATAITKQLGWFNTFWLSKCTRDAPRGLKAAW
jgi:hypothetical protein